MRRRWDLPELDGPEISTTLPGRSGARWSGGGRIIVGREEREREIKAAAVSSTASHARGSPPASPAMVRVLELSSPSFTRSFFKFVGARFDRLRRLKVCVFCLRACRFVPRAFSGSIVLGWAE